MTPGAFSLAQVLANPVLIVVGCGFGLGLILGIVWRLYRESDPKGWLQDEFGPSWTVDTTPSLREHHAAKPFTRNANVVPMRPSQLPRQATK